MNLNLVCIVTGALSVTLGVIVYQKFGIPQGLAAVGVLAIILTTIPVGIGLMISPFVGGYFGNMIGNIFYSYKKNRKPLPMYSVAEGKTQSGDFYGAISEYKKMLKIYPKDLKLYLGIIEVGANRLKNKEIAISFYKKGLKALSKKNGIVLKEIYEANISRVDDVESWEHDEEERFKSIKIKDYKDDMEWFREHFPERMKK